MKQVWKLTFAAAVFAVGIVANAEEAPKPTYKAVPVPQPYATGLLKDPTATAIPRSSEFLVGADDAPKKFELSELVELSPVFDQGNCGSCVYNAVVSALEDDYRLRGKKLDRLSRQFLMDCAAEWSCSGSFFSKVAGGLQQQGGTALETAYPYVARDQSCKGKPSQLYGKILSWKLISNSPKSIIGALRARHAVPVTVGADNSWMGYGGGVYNRCTRAGTNHQIVIVGYDCETSVDSSGKCVFDAQGKLPPGVGLWKIRNSWGTRWGEQGYMWTKMTSAGGSLCNNVAEEAGVMEVDQAPIPPDPGPTPDPTPSGPVDWKTIALVAAVLLSLVAVLVAVFKK